MNGTRKLVVFTDLDGTLLDHQTYSFAEAGEALDLLARQRIPVVLCSSKTRAEIELLQQDLKLAHPFISENGGGLFVPRGYFPFSLPRSRQVSAFDVVEFSKPYAYLIDVLHRVSRSLGIEVVGFSDMSTEQVARECKLSLAEARLAKLREYDEPFRVVDPNGTAGARLFEALQKQGLRCTSGGRYHHLTGAHDKGAAVRTLRQYYEAAWGKIRSVGLGDGLNDASLLREVDVAIVVPNPAAGATTRLLREVPRARLAAATGPRGWNDAVLEVAAKCASA
jgi:mannosyl-3-phosphoglycerate phosphatase